MAQYERYRVYELIENNHENRKCLTILQVNLLLHCLQAQFQFTIFSSQTICVSLLIRNSQEKQSLVVFIICKLVIL